MINQSLLLIVLIIIASFGLSFFQYYKAVFKKEKTAYLFFILRAITYSIIGILLLNLNVEQKNTQIQPKTLVLAVDNSSSVAQLSDSTAVQKWVEAFLEDEQINNKFDVAAFQFGERFRTLQKLNFKDSETNIAQVFFESKQLVTHQNSPLILLSDGNVTFGNDVLFESNTAGFDVYPIVLGDTTAFVDSKIDQTNINSYAFLNNKFPIETFVSYNGDDNFNTKVQLKKDNQIIAEEKINFSPNEVSKRVQFEVLASQIGIQSFEIFLVPNENEKQVENNQEEIAIEVIDESSTIKILTSFIHPDLGVLKKSIESNQQRKVEITPIQNFNGDLEDANLLILYQPTREFNSVFEQLDKANLPHIIITGTKTDYQFLNRVQNDFTKQVSPTTEEYFPSFNNDFLLYQQQDFNVESFPPLEDVFGSIELNGQSHILLNQKIQGLVMDEPLLFFVTQDEPRRAYLFGEQIWRWRATSFLDENKSFETFDNFMNKWVSYLSLNQKKSRLIVDAKSIYKSQQNQKIKATLFDQNYELDKKSTLFIKFRDNEGQTREFPMLFSNSNFEFNLDALDAGSYNYEIFSPEQKLSYKGELKIITYSPEQQFVNANTSLLKSISFDGAIFSLNDFDRLKEKLLENTAYTPIQKENIKLKPLIDWKILFIFLVLSLSLEWFFRKYNGLI